MSDQALAVIQQLREAVWTDIVGALKDEKREQRIREVLARVAEPDFEVHMWAPADLGGTEFHGTGVEGFRQIWSEWVEPYESFRPQLEKRLESAGRVVDLVKLIATTRTGRVPIEQDAAAVWTVRGGKIVRVDFYLSQDDALRAAGIDSDHLPGE